MLPEPNGLRLACWVNVWENDGELLAVLLLLVSVLFFPVASGLIVLANPVPLFILIKRLNK